MHREARIVARRFGCFLLMGFLVTLAACAGGNTGLGVPPLSVDGPSRGTRPGPIPSTYPGSNGETLVYSGKMTQKFQSFPEVVAPGSTPEPVSVTKGNVSQTITVRTRQSFNGGKQLVDLHDEESDAYASGLKVTTSTTDSFEKRQASQLLNYGSQYVDESGDTMTTSYAPPRVEDTLPENPGAQWSNGAGALVLEGLAGDKKGSPITVSRTVHDDGTYSESTTYPPGYSALGYTGVGQIQENTDGTGTYAFVANGSPLTIVYSQPVPQLSGPPLITIGVYQQLDPTSGSTPTSVSTLASWYGTAPALYNEIDRDFGEVAVPAPCALRSKFPKSATEIRKTIDTTDTVLGYTDHEVSASYVVPGFGVLCSTLQDTQTLYYDFNGDQPFVFTEAPPLEIASLSETLALKSSSADVHKSSRIAPPASSDLDIAPALRAGFERAVETNRRRFANHILKTLLAARTRGALR
jgi:hypothetical protein